MNPLSHSNAPKVDALLVAVVIAVLASSLVYYWVTGHGAELAVVMVIEAVKAWRCRTD